MSIDNLSKSIDKRKIKLSAFADYLEKMGIYTPLAIIREYLLKTEQEIEAIEMITALAEGKANRVQAQLDYARSWIPNIIDIYEANKYIPGVKVDKETAKLLDRLTKYCMLGMDLPEELLEKAKAVIPNMKTPSLIFVPMVDWLRNNYNIRFSDDKENKNG